MVDKSSSSQSSTVSKYFFGVLCWRGGHSRGTGKQDMQRPVKGRMPGHLPDGGVFDLPDHRRSIAPADLSSDNDPKFRTFKHTSKTSLPWINVSLIFMTNTRMCR